MTVTFFLNDQQNHDDGKLMRIRGHRFDPAGLMKVACASGPGLLWKAPAIWTSNFGIV
jgi:hypothetical protein